jgi:hypothetical protein
MSPSPLIEVGPTRDSSDPPVALEMKVRHLTNCIPPDLEPSSLIPIRSRRRCSRKAPLRRRRGGVALDLSAHLATLGLAPSYLLPRRPFALSNGSGLEYLRIVFLAMR